MKVILYTDGAARGNPEGPGGYGAILEYIDTKKLSVVWIILLIANIIILIANILNGVKKK